MHSSIFIFAIVIGSLQAARDEGRFSQQQGARFPQRPAQQHGGRPEEIGKPLFGLPWFPFPQPAFRPAFVGTFQSNQTRDPQVNMYQLYADIYGDSSLTNEAINLQVSRLNATTYQLVESVNNAANTTLQSVTFQLGEQAEANFQGSLVDVVARALGDQLILSYNSTAIALTRLILGGAGDGHFNRGLSVEYRAGNVTGKRQLRRVL
ncbi:hypothetical protein BV898_10406 [Hypsibius exemplaris]|uniref:SEA domain-containing protein n=1 Tax=Hypsibius exemplaris TaxID=2072580 RepID=A0A1W0WJM1_HYPEX|nr:hypothetical protein BV898_10406 [Hypsibius exemplaris]